MNELDPQFRAKMNAIIQILDSIDEFVKNGSILYLDENGRNFSIVEHNKVIMGD